jgi:hypothetical protein
LEKHAQLLEKVAQLVAEPILHRKKRPNYWKMWPNQLPNYYIKTHLESPKYLHQIISETLKFQKNPCLDTAYLGQNVKQAFPA